MATVSPFIVQAGAEVLRNTARELKSSEIGTPEFKALVAKMIHTMRTAPGVGLAAPQIGVPVRVIVLEDRAATIETLDPDLVTRQKRVAFPVKVIVNPVLEILQPTAPKAQFFEGCLSVRGYKGEVARHERVKVTGLDENGEHFEWEVEGWPARILQHELDHLNGMLYIDRIDDMRTFQTTAPEVPATFVVDFPASFAADAATTTNE